MQPAPSHGELTAEELKHSIEKWLMEKYDLDVNYSPIEPIKQLEDLGLLNRHVSGMCELI